MKTTEAHQNTLSFLKGQEKFMMQPGQIVRLEADSNYTRVFFTNHPPVLMAKVLRNYELLLSAHGFIRPHRSHLVNLQHVECFDGRGNILMRDASRVEISRRKRRQLRMDLTVHHSITLTQETSLL